MYTYINNLIDSCSHKNGCWFYGFLSLAANKPLRYLPPVTVKVNNSLVIFNDEIYETVENIPYENFVDSIVLTGSPTRHKQFLKNNINALFWPWLHWFRYLIPVRRIGTLPVTNKNTEYIFNFLNRHWHSGRDHLIRFITEQHPKLINTGFITAKEYVYYCDYPGIKKDVDFIKVVDNFKKGTRIEDPTDSSLLKEGCSIIVNNFYHIAEHIPGTICIQVETAEPNQDFFPLISEKSMLPFITKRIPILISNKPGVIDLLRNEGFDVFDDIINHGYDQIEDYHQRLQQCIDLNLSVLNGKIKIPDVESRLANNQEFLIGHWSNRKLNELIGMLT